MSEFYSHQRCICIGCSNDTGTYSIHELFYSSRGCIGSTKFHPFISKEFEATVLFMNHLSVNTVSGKTGKASHTVLPTRLRIKSHTSFLRMLLQGFDKT